MNGETTSVSQSVSAGSGGSSRVVAGEERCGPPCQRTAGDSRAHARHHILVEGEVVRRQQHRGDDLIRLHHMMQIGAAELAAGGAGTGRIDRRRIVGVARVLQVQRAVPGERLPVAA